MKECLLCSDCFENIGLSMMAYKIGIDNDSECENCGRTTGRILDEKMLEKLVQDFFIRGSVHKCEFGEAPTIEVNYLAKTEVELGEDLNKDVKLLDDKLGTKFFYYGPRMWMVGDTEPLRRLRSEVSRDQEIEKILNSYPALILDSSLWFFRLRIKPVDPNNIEEFDSPPLEIAKKSTGRFDSNNETVLYGSSDLDTCIHECKVTSKDEVYIAMLEPTKSLRVLDLSIHYDDGLDEFESLDESLAMLFNAGEHSYPITQRLAQLAFERGYEGIIYPSFYTNVRLGIDPIETVYGISTRRIPEFKQMHEGRVIENIVLFGRPIAEGKIRPKTINRLVLKKIDYDFTLGPVVPLDK